MNQEGELSFYYLCVDTNVRSYPFTLVQNYELTLPVSCCRAIHLKIMNTQILSKAPFFTTSLILQKMSIRQKRFGTIQDLFRKLFNNTRYNNDIDKRTLQYNSHYVSYYLL